MGGGQEEIVDTDNLFKKFAERKKMIIRLNAVSHEDFYRILDICVSF